MKIVLGFIRLLAYFALVLVLLFLWLLWDIYTTVPF